MMKLMGLILAGLQRNLMRSGLTILSIVIAFLLFGLLKPVSDVFTSGPDIPGGSRLIVAARHSITDMLTVKHADQIRQVPGIKVVAHQTWFGGTYIDPANVFPQYAVTAATFMELHTELILPRAQLEAFKNTRSGIIVGRQIADEFDLKIGDKVPIIPNIWHNRDGIHWEFDLVGIFDGKHKTTDTRRLFMNYEFFDEYRAFGKGLISNVLVSVENPQQSINIAQRIDAVFANSSDETLTSTEREYALGFVKQLGNIGLIVNAILLSVFFTILLLTANTMSQAIRDRIPEFAILKTLGFQDITLLWLVLAESIILMLTGALLGMGLAALGLFYADELVPATRQMGQLDINLEVFITALGIAVLTGILVGLPPAIQAKRINIIEALRIS